jgi:CheY-like chemotaxis protein
MKKPQEVKILYIEDEEENMILIERIIQSEGYNFVGAELGNLGIEKARQLHPDLILSDLNLPDIDGYQIIRILKNDSSLKTIPVIAITASAMKDDIKKIKEAGFDSYILKPIDVDDLLEKISEYLKI